MYFATQYIAMVFFCASSQCGVVSIQIPFDNKIACQQSVDSMVEQLSEKKVFTVVEGRCLDFRSGIKS